MIKSRSFFTLVMMFFVVFSFLVQHSRGDIMAFWDFGTDTLYSEGVLIDSISGVPTLVLEGGDKDDNGKLGVAYRDSGNIFHAAGRAGAWNNVNGDSEILITVDTTGWRDLAIRWDYNSENTAGDLGPATFDMDVRAGGVGDWVEVENNRVIDRDMAWHEFSRDMSLFNVIENTSVVEIRIRDLSRDDESGGDFLIDNIELAGTPLSSSLTLLHPNGDVGDVDDSELIGGSDYLIEWSSVGTVDSVAIDYSLDNGGSWEAIDTVGDVGYYDWEVPDANSFGGVVRVTNTSNASVTDSSDRAFRVYQCSLMFDLNGDCEIDIRDFALLASEWLVCGKPEDMACY